MNLQDAEYKLAGFVKQFQVRVRPVLPGVRVPPSYRLICPFAHVFVHPSMFRVETVLPVNAVEVWFDTMYSRSNWALAAGRAWEKGKLTPSASPFARKFTLLFHRFYGIMTRNSMEKICIWVFSFTE